MRALREITETEYAAWLDQAVRAYAQDKVTSGAWAENGAHERSRVEHEALLPQGRQTTGHHLYSILAESGEVVGTIWFAAETRGDSRVAYIYNIFIDPSRRRKGNATRAIAALEHQIKPLGLTGIALHVFAHNLAAKSLYEKLGFKPMNFNLYKPLGNTGA